MPAATLRFVCSESSYRLITLNGSAGQLAIDHLSSVASITCLLGAETAMQHHHV